MCLICSCVALPFACLSTESVGALRPCLLPQPLLLLFPVVSVLQRLLLLLVLLGLLDGQEELQQQACKGTAAEGELGREVEPTAALSIPITEATTTATANSPITLNPDNFPLPPLLPTLNSGGSSASE